MSNDKYKVFNDETKKGWKKQQDDQIAIYDSPDEWFIVEDYIKKMGIKTTESQKISRKDLVKFVKEQYPDHPEFVNFVQHSFLLLHDEFRNECKIGVMARSKKYEDSTGQQRQDGNLGAGGFGKVLPGKFRPFDKLLQETNPPELLALKVAADVESTADKKLGYMVSEQENLYKAGILRGYAFRPRDQQLAKGYVAMPIYGESLSSYLNKNRNLPEDIKGKIAKAAAVALKELHDKNLIHRDIKAGNLTLSVDANGDFKVNIIDLGLSAKIPDGKTEIIDVQMGSPDYKAPEISNTPNSSRYSKASDIYALGVMFKKMGIEIESMLSNAPNDRGSLDTVIANLDTGIKNASEKSDPNKYLPNKVRKYVGNDEKNVNKDLKQIVMAKETAKNAQYKAELAEYADALLEKIRADEIESPVNVYTAETVKTLITSAFGNEDQGLSEQDFANLVEIVNEKLDQQPVSTATAKVASDVQPDTAPQIPVTELENIYSNILQMNLDLMRLQINIAQKGYKEKYTEIIENLRANVEENKQLCDSYDDGALLKTKEYMSHVEKEVLKAKSIKPKTIATLLLKYEKNVFNELEKTNQSTSTLLAKAVTNLSKLDLKTQSEGIIYFDRKWQKIADFVNSYKKLIVHTDVEIPDVSDRELEEIMSSSALERIGTNDLSAAELDEYTKDTIAQDEFAVMLDGLANGNVLDKQIHVAITELRQKLEGDELLDASTVLVEVEGLISQSEQEPSSIDRKKYNQLLQYIEANQIYKDHVVTETVAPTPLQSQQTPVKPKKSLFSRIMPTSSLTWFKKQPSTVPKDTNEKNVNHNEKKRRPNFKWDTQPAQENYKNLQIDIPPGEQAQAVEKNFNMYLKDLVKLGQPYSTIAKNLQQKGLAGLDTKIINEIIEKEYTNISGREVDNTKNKNALTIYDNIIRLVNRQAVLNDKNSGKIIQTRSLIAPKLGQNIANQHYVVSGVGNNCAIRSVIKQMLLHGLADDVEKAKVINTLNSIYINYSSQVASEFNKYEPISTDGKALLNGFGTLMLDYENVKDADTLQDFLDTYFSTDVYGLSEGDQNINKLVGCFRKMTEAEYKTAINNPDVSQENMQWLHDYAKQLIDNGLQQTLIDNNLRLDDMLLDEKIFLTLLDPFDDINVSADKVTLLKEDGARISLVSILIEKLQFTSGQEIDPRYINQVIRAREQGSLATELLDSKYKQSNKFPGDEFFGADRENMSMSAPSIIDVGGHFDVVAPAGFMQKLAQKYSQQIEYVQEHDSSQNAMIANQQNYFIPPPPGLGPFDGQDSSKLFEESKVQPADLNHNISDAAGEGLRILFNNNEPSLLKLDEQLSHIENNSKDIAPRIKSELGMKTINDEDEDKLFSSHDSFGSGKIHHDDDGTMHVINNIKEIREPGEEKITHILMNGNTQEVNHENILSESSRVSVDTINDLFLDHTELWSDQTRESSDLESASIRVGNSSSQSSVSTISSVDEIAPLHLTETTEFISKDSKILNKENTTAIVKEVFYDGGLRTGGKNVSQTYKMDNQYNLSTREDNKAIGKVKITDEGGVSLSFASKQLYAAVHASAQALRACYLKDQSAVFVLNLPKVKNTDEAKLVLKALTNAFNQEMSNLNGVEAVLNRVILAPPVDKKTRQIDTATQQAFYEVLSYDSRNELAKNFVGVMRSKVDLDAVANGEMVEKPATPVLQKRGGLLSAFGLSAKAKAPEFNNQQDFFKGFAPANGTPKPPSNRPSSVRF